MKKSRASAAKLKLCGHKSKIVIVDPLGGHGGLHYYIDGLARGLVKAGVEVSVFVSSHSPILGDEPYCIRRTFGSVYSSHAKVIRGAIFLLGILYSLLLVRLRRIKIINYHFFRYGWMELIVVTIVRVLRLSLIATIHDVESFGSRSNNFIKSRILAIADAVIVHNQFSKEILESSVNLKGKLLAVIPHGNYIHAFPVLPSRIEARERLKLDVDDFVFLFFGNNRPEKGLDRLLLAAADLPRDISWTLLVAGKMKPDQLLFYLDLVNEYGLTNRVRFDARHVSDEDAPSYYLSANLVVVPYHIVYESGVTIMAQSLGVAVLVSNLPPLVEATGCGACGLLFDSDDKLDLAKALRAALSGVHDLTKLGYLGQKHVIETRSWDIIGELTADLIQQIIEKPIRRI